MSKKIPLEIGIFKALNFKGFISISIAFLLLFAGCKKEIKNAFTIEEINSPARLPVTASLWLDNTQVLIASGKKNNSGQIHKSIDGGKTWYLVHQGKLCVYDLHVVNDTIMYACGDSLLILRSNDGGENWKKIDFGFQLEYFNYTPLRAIFGNYRFLMMVGGENFNNGNALWFESDVMRWVWHFDHEWRSGIGFEGTNYLLTGYGNSYRTSDYGYHYSPTELKGDFFTGAEQINSSTAYLCGYNGGIYKTEDAGVSWKPQVKENKAYKKRVHFNTICFLNPSTGACFGNDGIIYFTKDGATWANSESPVKETIHSSSNYQNEKYFIGTESGRLFFLKP